METKNKKICYTAITGNYDTLKEPNVITNGWDYICFTNCINIKSKTWKIYPIPRELSNLSNVKIQRMIKICPHRYLPEYNECLWVDGNITIKCDLNKFVGKFCYSDFHTVKHPDRDCIYDECMAVIRLKKDTKENVNEVLEWLKHEGFPHNFGLAETGLMYRKNTQNTNDICDEWGRQMLSRKTHRDQLMFNYSIWKVGGKVEYLPKDIVRNGKLFSLCRHKK